MPVSGKFLVCQRPEVVSEHRHKVYAPAMAGAPPMSVPHLDWRTIYGKDCIFFGPFAGFKPTVYVNKSGLANVWEWVKTINSGNLIPFAKSALYNLDLVAYLLKEVFASKRAQLKTLRDFVPDAKLEDWTMIWAGQRIQTVHPNGQLMFGTEVVTSPDRTLVGLLGASPGASVSPHIAIEVMSNFHMAGDSQVTQHWHAALASMIPSHGRSINDTPGLYEQIFANADRVLFREAPTSAQNITKVFKRLDTDASGSISPAELRAHLETQGLDAAAIGALIKKIDADNSGDITEDEFRAGFTEFITGQLKTNAKM
jgi:malate dehydrogenase (quinone)